MSLSADFCKSGPSLSMSMYPPSALGPPTYRPYDDYSRPLDDYRAAMGDFSVPGHPPPVPGSWAATPTSLTQPPDERHHEDTVSHYATFSFLHTQRFSICFYTSTANKDGTRADRLFFCETFRQKSEQPYQLYFRYK